ncbi:MAG TPA: hypothetical protein DEA52_04070 [Clostridiaceae bacterium]|nr:hypothetical protein [Clostridiaceae bacterium]
MFLLWLLPKIVLEHAENFHLFYVPTSIWSILISVLQGYFIVSFLVALARAGISLKVSLRALVNPSTKKTHKKQKLLMGW